MTPRLSIGFLALSVSILGAESGERAELQALRAQVQQLEQQLKVLSQQIDAKERALGGEAATPPRASTLADVASRSDVPIAAEASPVVRVRGLVQVDARRFVGDDAGLVSDTVAIRRARLIAEGTVGRRYGYLFGAEFGGSSVNLRDASFSVWLSDEARLSAGKMKAPLGLEMLQAAATTTFLERSLVTRLVPIRDIGVQLDGALFEGKVNYAGGIFNGAPDGGSSATNADFDQDTDFVGRVMFSPWAKEEVSPLKGLAFGVGGSQGNHHGSAGRPSAYRSDAQQIFFQYEPAVVSDGEVWRLSPQFNYRLGAWGLMGEYVISRATLRATAVSPLKRQLENRAWQLTTAYMLTGEASTYGQVTPRAEFDPAGGAWGAFEVALRYAGAEMDAAAFPVFASGGANAERVRAYTLGLNWYLSKAVVLKFNYSLAEFEWSALTMIPPRGDEQAVMSRLQLGF